ncbi:MAG: SusC/RagA family TonB-linked outer membrane protein [Salegentibacter sp.]
MKKRLNGILTLLLAFVVQITFAQQKTVSGTVTDEEGLPLPGVNVLVQGTTRGVQTDFDGEYSIQTSQGEVLVFSFIGMEKTEVTVGSPSVVDVVMKQSSAELEEVIVTAVGISREKSSLGSATTTLDSEEINRGAQSNIADALKGKVAGVSISSASTDPGASSGVIIRGVSSMSGSNQPLYVIDGVPINNGSAFQDSLDGAYDFGRGSQDVNPENIKTMTILKGASATALYGSRAASGAIIITTKSGQSGNLKVDLSSSTFFSQILRTPHYQSTFGQGWDGLHYLIENGSWGARFDGQERVWGNIVNNSQQLKPYVFQKDQLENFFTTGTYFQNSGAISGGSETTTARLSFSTLDQDGIFPSDADSFNRHTIGVSAQSKIGDIHISGSLNYVNTDGASVAAGQGITVMNNLMQIPNDFNISGFEDYHNPFNNISNYYTPYGITNPYFTLNENGTDYTKERLYGSLEASYDVTDWSTLTYRFGLDQYSSNTKVWEAIVAPVPGSPNYDTSTKYPGTYAESTAMVKQLNHDLLYDVNVDVFEDFNIQTTTGFNANSRRSSSLGASVGSQDLPGFYSLSNSGEDPAASSSISERRLYGLYNTTTLGYKNQLFLTGNIRNDWYSTLPKENQSVLYGGGNASWVFSRTFDKISDVVNYGKLRAGYGSVGVDTDPYQVLPVYVAGASDNQGFRSLNFPLNGYNAYEVGNRAANPNLKPERRKEFEAGVDLEFFKNRISLDFTYYNAVVENQILSLPLAATSGYTSQTANLGKISNEGIEALLKVAWFRNSDGFGWNTSFNFSQNNSELVELDPRLEQVSLGGLSTVSLIAKEGSPLALIEGPVAEYSPEGQMVVDADGVPIASPESEVYGDTQYDYTLGINNEFSYKNLSLGFTLDVRQGGLMYSRTADIARFTGNSITTTYNDRKPFIVPNSVQKVTDADGNVSYVQNNTAVSVANMDNYFTSSAFSRADVIDKSFVKLREVVLNYSLPEKLLDRTPLNNLTFSVIGRNLFLWTPESNQYIDPEVSTFGTDLASQFGEFSASPSTRSIGISIKTSF